MSRKPLLLALALISPVGLTHAQPKDNFSAATAEEVAPKMILFQLESIEINTEDLFNLTFGDKLLRSGDLIRGDVDKLLMLKRANVVESISHISRAGERSRVAQVEQVIYPTEYDPPSFKPAVYDKKGNIMLAEKRDPASPTSFEERAIGTKIETESRFQESHYPIMKIAIEGDQVDQLKDLIHTTYYFKGLKNVIKMPVFTKYALQTTITLRHQSTNLTAISSVFDEAGKLKANRHLVTFTKATLIVLPH